MSELTLEERVSELEQKVAELSDNLPCSPIFDKEFVKKFIPCSEYQLRRTELEHPDVFPERLYRFTSLKVGKQCRPMRIRVYTIEQVKFIRARLIRGRRKKLLI